MTSPGQDLWSRRSFLLSAALFGTACGDASHDPRKTRLGDRDLEGATLLVGDSGPADAIDQQLTEMADVGFSSVQFAPSVDWLRGDSGAFDTLTQHIRTASTAGLTVVVRPLVDEPGRRDGTVSAHSWLDSYFEVVDGVSRAAAAGDAAAMLIGDSIQVDLASEGVWRTQCERIRDVFTGQLGFVAGEDSLIETGIWDAVDLMAIRINAPLVSDPTADVEALTAAWQHRLDDFGRIAQRAGREVVIAHVGFRSVRGVTAGVDLGQLDFETSETEQAAAVQALLVGRRDTPMASRHQLVVLVSLR